MLDVRRLRVLREVARRGSLAGAADVLSYTPSAVSQQISVLEREAGTRLLERRARGVVLTEAGQTLVEHAEEILARLDAAEAALAALADLRRGHLRMASFATAGASVLPRAVDAFRARHPAIELTVRQASPLESVAQLREGRLDIALTVDLDDRPAEGVEVIRLFEDRLRLALHRDHPLAANDEVRLEDLEHETWIDVPLATSGGQTAARACARAGFVPRVAFESDDYTAIRELVGAGAGIALLPDLALFAPHESVVLRSLGPDRPFRTIQVATRPEAFRSPAASAMLDDPVRAAPRARPSGRRRDAPEPVAGDEARVGERRAVGAERLDREGRRAVDRQLAEDAPEQAGELRRVARADADRDPRLARHEVDDEVAIRRHVVQAAARVQLRAGVAREDRLREARHAPHALGVRAPRALVRARLRPTEVLRRLRRHLAVDGEAVVLVVAVAVPEPDREAVGREVGEVGRRVVGDLLLREPDRPVDPEALQQPARPRAGADDHRLGLELAGRRW